MARQILIGPLSGLHKAHASGGVVKVWRRADSAAGIKKRVDEALTPYFGRARFEVEAKLEKLRRKREDT